MIVAPLMTPILGLVLSVVLHDGPNLRHCLILLVAGAAAVVGLAWILGLFVPYPVVAATSSQLLFVTNVIAILATGIVVMTLYRVSWSADGMAPTSPRHAGALGLVGLILLAVIVPLWVNSQRFDRCRYTKPKPEYGPSRQGTGTRPPRPPLLVQLAASLVLDPASTVPLPGPSMLGPPVGFRAGRQH